MRVWFDSFEPSFEPTISSTPLFPIDFVDLRTLSTEWITGIHATRVMIYRIFASFGHRSILRNGLSNEKCVQVLFLVCYMVLTSTNKTNCQNLSSTTFQYGIFFRELMSLV